MRVVRRPAIQGHAIPATAHRAFGPFSEEILRPQPIESIEEEQIDPRANAQNNYQPPRLMQCRRCREVLDETETKNHLCGGSHG